ncbi:hypothetical protein PYCCODRAFT_1307556 [Trametes coccinea BRFM310]|uniref:Uncharacterized protein n=1 Tax=Trametes coccinea (strain BRFM310) TaxID=1353009 RepID=A0A1Y2I5Q7_TRAC3|nr:hypothetical protein PYCCODRAFT_1307556 [Trametes coccinea BRFM310]
MSMEVSTVRKAYALMGAVIRQSTCSAWTVPRTTPLYRIDKNLGVDCLFAYEVHQDRLFWTAPLWIRRDISVRAGRRVRAYHLGNTADSISVLTTHLLTHG